MPEAEFSLHGVPTLPVNLTALKDLYAVESGTFTAPVTEEYTCGNPCTESPTAAFGLGDLGSLGEFGVPEPGTLTLMGLGLAGIAFAEIRLRKAKKDA